MPRATPPLPTTTLRQARQLRSSQTEAEARLWYHLRAGRFNGLKFRRQHPLPPYIADFCCVEGRLVIELDGSQHSPDGDAARTRYLQSQGWQVLRFWDNDVLGRTDAVLEAIWNSVLAADPLPNPSPGGRGA